MTQTPARFRSSFTGPEIDKLLASVGGKLDSTSIINDYSGGTTNVASAELAKDLNDRILQILDPNFFKSLVDAIPDYNAFTDADKEKLDSIDTTSFKGVFTNAAQRSASLITSGYTGLEITFLLDDGTGLQSWDYWDAGTSSWKKSKLISIDDVLEVNFPVVGTATFTSFDKTEFKLAKMIIHGFKTTQCHVTEILVATNGTDTFLTFGGDIGNAVLYDISSIITGSNVDIQVTTLTTGVTLRVRTIAQY